MSLWNMIRELLGETSGPQQPVTPVPQAAPPKAPKEPPPPVPEPRDPAPPVKLTTSWQYALAPLLDLLGHTEGTDKRRGYNETLAYGLLTGGDVNLEGMTLTQIDALQTRMLQHPKNKWNSSAIGRYQIVRTTLRKLAVGLAPSTRFTSQLQDLFALKLLVGRGLVKWLSNTMTTNAFIDQLAREWASIPTSKGVGFYDGQRVGATADAVRDVLSKVGTRMTHSVLAEIKSLTT